MLLVYASMGTGYANARGTFLQLEFLDPIRLWNPHLLNGRSPGHIKGRVCAQCAYHAGCWNKTSVNSRISGAQKIRYLFLLCSCHCFLVGFEWLLLFPCGL